jgi:hypothetical protein
MKKIAFFVEGQTEQLFINRLLKEVAGYRNISITLKEIKGGGRRRPTKQEFLVSQPFQNPEIPIYEALIYDCHNDDRVKSEILDNIDSMALQGYTQIVGIRDLFPNTLIDLPRMEKGVNYIPPSNRSLPVPFDIIIAVHEIEAWFLAEYTHFEKISRRLTEHHIASSLGFDPFTDDMTLRYHPAKDLNDIYRLAAKNYQKKYWQVKRTVNKLDYSFLYLSTRNSVVKLNELLTIIDNFLT